MFALFFKNYFSSVAYLSHLSLVKSNHELCSPASLSGCPRPGYIGSVATGGGKRGGDAADGGNYPNKLASTWIVIAMPLLATVFGKKNQKRQYSNRYREYSASFRAIV